MACTQGVDYRKVERSLDERTAKLPRMTQEQEEEYKALESELKYAEAEVEKAKSMAASEGHIVRLQEAVAAKKAEQKEFATKIRQQGMVKTDVGMRFERPVLQRGGV